MSFEEHIKEWVSADNKLKILNDKSRELRTNKNNITNNILKFVETNKLNEASINISDGKLKFASVKQTGTITLKLVENCLKDCLENEELVDKIMTHIKDSRVSKETLDIKRSYFDK